VKKINPKRTQERIHLQEVTNMSKIPKGQMYHHTDDGYKYYSIDDDRYEDNSFFDQRHYDFDTLGDYLQYLIEWNGLFADAEDMLKDAVLWANGDERIADEKLKHLLHINKNRARRHKHE